MLLLLSLYFQLVKGLSPLTVGVVIIPLDIASVFLGPISGKLSDRYGHLPFTTGGLALTSLALFLLATTDYYTPYPYLLVYLVLLGAGLGVFASPNMSSIMGSVPPERRGVASGFRATLFNVGFTISLNLAILVTTFTVPYALVTQMIASPNPVAISVPERIQFARGLQLTYLAMGALNTLAIVPSMLRGRRVRANSVAAPEPAALMK